MSEEPKKERMPFLEQLSLDLQLGCGPRGVGWAVYDPAEGRMRFEQDGQWYELTCRKCEQPPETVGVRPLSAGGQGE